MVTLNGNLSARTRLLALVEILTMYSDEQNIITIEEICTHLTDYGYEVSKRLVLADIKAINETPLKIIGVSTPKKGYYIAKCFSQDAIYLILEAIFSSDVLSEKRYGIYKELSSQKHLLAYSRSGSQHNSQP